MLAIESLISASEIFAGQPNWGTPWNFDYVAFKMQDAIGVKRVGEGCSEREIAILGGNCEVSGMDVVNHKELSPECG